MRCWASVIDQIRRENGMSTKRLCLNANVHRSTYRNSISGTGKLSIDQVERLIGVFGYDLDIFEMREAR